MTMSLAFKNWFHSYVLVINKCEVYKVRLQTLGLDFFSNVKGKTKSVKFTIH